MIPEITFHNETHEDQDDLIRCLQVSVSRTIHRVSDATKMPLVKPIRVRMVTPKGLGRANRLYLKEKIQSVSIPECDCGHGCQKRDERAVKFIAKVAPSVLGSLAHLACPMTGGQAMHGEEYNDILLCPDTLSRLKVKQEGLDAIMAHEVTHHAQNDHQPRFMDDRLESLYSNPEEEKDKDISSLFEGHATWAHHRITEDLHGYPVEKFSTAKDSDLIVSRIRTLPYRIIKKKSDYTQGKIFIERVHEHGGYDLVNNIWQNKRLIPTREHIKNPESWINDLTTTN